VLVVSRSMGGAAVTGAKADYMQHQAPTPSPTTLLNAPVHERVPGHCIHAGVCPGGPAQPHSCILKQPRIPTTAAAAAATATAFGARTAACTARPPQKQQSTRACPTTAQRCCRCCTAAASPGCPCLTTSRERHIAHSVQQAVAQSRLLAPGCGGCTAAGAGARRGCSGCEEPAPRVVLV